MNPEFDTWVTQQLTGTGLSLTDARAASAGSPRTDPAALAIRAGYATATTVTTEAGQ